MEINDIKDYFNSEIQESRAMNKRLSKYIAVFDYIDNTFIILSATSGGVSVFFFLQELLELLQQWQVQVLLLYFFFHNRNNKEIIKPNKTQKEET